MSLVQARDVAPEALMEELNPVHYNLLKKALSRLLQLPDHRNGVVFAGMTKAARRCVHTVAGLGGCTHVSSGEGSGRIVTVKPKQANVPQAAASTPSVPPPSVAKSIDRVGVIQKLATENAEIKLRANEALKAKREATEAHQRVEQEKKELQKYQERKNEWLNKSRIQQELLNVQKQKASALQQELCCARTASSKQEVERNTLTTLLKATQKESIKTKVCLSGRGAAPILACLDGVLRLFKLV